MVEILLKTVAIFYTCGSSVAHGLDTVSYIPCPMDANMISHNLTRPVYDFKIVLVNWEGVPLSFIIPDIVFDVTII